MSVDISAAVRYAEEKQLALFDYAFMTEDGVSEWVSNRANPLNNSYSVTKSFAATAIGLLWEDGRIDLDEPILDVLAGEYIQPADPRWHQVLVRHALSHTMGIECGYLDIDVEDIFSYGTDDFLKVALSAPLTHAPGTHFCYSDAAYYLVSRMVSRRAGEKLDDFLMHRLLYPMRVQEAAFSRCPQHHPIGATGLYIRARDMVKLGWLYADGGFFEGKRLLSEAWVETERANRFAFQRHEQTGLFCKGGMYGQMLLYDPAHRFAAAWHSYTTDRRAEGLMEITCDIAHGAGLL